MIVNQFSLLSKRRFLPLFMTQFLGAFNDNFYKNALVVLITYMMSEPLGVQSDVLVALAGGLLILPMFLFSAQAGTIADKFEKSRLIRFVKIAEIILMTCAAIGFVTQNVYFLLVVLFLVGIQATFFGPLKYSILPAQLEKDELVAGNALIEMGTFLAVLLGYIISVFLIRLPHGLFIIAGMIILMAMLGFISSCFILKARAPSPELPLSLNFIQETGKVIAYSKKKPIIFLTILGISWFWLLGFTFLTLFPTYAKSYIGADERVFVLFLATFSVGIGVGSILCNRLLKGRIEATFVPLAALGMSIFTVDLFFATQHEMGIVHTMQLLSPLQYLATFNHWRILFDMFMIAVSGGVYIVPLYALLQDRSEPTHLSRVIASNNIMNALFMSVAALVLMILLKFDVSLPHVFLLVALVNLVVVFKSCELLPGVMVRSVLRTILHFMYDVEIKGVEHFHEAGERVVIAPNHTSFIDGLLVAAFLPGRVAFAVYAPYVTKWWMKPITLFADVFGVEPTNPYLLKSMIHYVRGGHKLVIFPEGRISVTGGLMKIYEGPGLIADKADAAILPVLIEGAQYTPFSRHKVKIRTQWFPKITLTVFKPVHYQVDHNLPPRKRRQIIGDKLYETMSRILFLGDNIDTTLFQSLLDAKDIHGGHHIIAEDVSRQPLTYNRFILGSIVLGSKIAKISHLEENVGILLPNFNGTAITLFGLLAHQRVAALLNFSTGANNVLKGCHAARVRLVISARKFIEAAKFQPMVDLLENDGIKIVYLEDLKNEITIFEKLSGLVAFRFPKWFKLTGNAQKAKKPAVILFTSGTEGTPKAVVLSHRNIQANKSQLSSRINFSPSDIVLNAMPMFHSFGLTGGTFMPLFYGMRVFFYPSPLHYRLIPEVSYDINATILFGTNTFLAGYAHYAKSYDFYSLRFVFAGAEKLRDENRRLWSDKFGVRILEGYGTTEASPVISANTPMYSRAGSVGKLMPGIEIQLKPVPDLPQGGQLWVKGPNIMLGYMFESNPGVIVSPLDGWYDTGDIVTIDADGFIFIQGRAKRFAKIGGEMISLAYVEHYLEDLWPDARHAVICVPDEKKGEQLILVTTQANADRTAIVAYVKEQGITELSIPKMIKIVKTMPLLGTGKIDYNKISTVDFMLGD